MKHLHLHTGRNTGPARTPDEHRTYPGRNLEGLFSCWITPDVGQRSYTGPDASPPRRGEDVRCTHPTSSGVEATGTSETGSGSSRTQPPTWPYGRTLPARPSGPAVPGCNAPAAPQRLAIRSRAKGRPGPRQWSKASRTGLLASRNGIGGRRGSQGGRGSPPPTEPTFDPRASEIRPIGYHFTRVGIDLSQQYCHE